MDVDTADDKVEVIEDSLKNDSNCPSIKIEPSADTGSLPIVSSQEDTLTEEKNDSGIR